jgi:hypothetical protein
VIASIWKTLVLAKSEHIGMCEDQVIGFAKLEWGKDVCCQFDREKLVIEIETFEGKLKRFDFSKELIP